jgi:hypothetical protein
MSLSILGLAIKTWTDAPGRWHEALVGVLFFGTGSVVLGVLWGMDSMTEVENHRLRTRALVVCGLVLTAVSLIIAFENIVVGSLGVAFCGWCTIALMRKTLRKT